MARKREERAHKAAQQKEKKAQAYLATDHNFVSFKHQLDAIGLEIKDIPGDGYVQNLEIIVCISYQNIK